MRVKSTNFILLIFSACALGACEGNPSSMELRSVTVSDVQTQVRAIYQTNPNDVTLSDAAIVLATANLPESSWTEATIATAVSHLLGVSTAIEGIAPVPEFASDVDFAEPPNTVTAVDSAVVLAAIAPVQSPPTKDDLLAAIAALDISLTSAEDILRIPGTTASVPPTVDQLLTTRACESCDLKGVDLRDVDLQEVNLLNADLGGAVLRGANLRGAVLTGADLGFADLRNSTFTDVTLAGADLSNADLRGADITNTNINEADDIFGLKQ